MESVQKNFLRRRRAIRKKHRRLAGGYVTRVNRMGVIEHRPRRSLGRITIMPLVLLAAMFLAFKAVLYVQLGEEAYLSHLDNLTTGSAVERAGAMVMQIDPVTERVLGLIETHL
ncbi:hypothetical protein SAMN05421759_10431 [Roseivivax lentus]|uniref:Uncharacterized protein n=2 Tax=Roseivivax lentus TaxID=633194 RepID=A0A1N7M726_9RHOB|nr:hypothetical protein SAMN05421759_10431 [Roseivivax lentus]